MQVKHAVLSRVDKNKIWLNLRHRNLTTLSHARWNFRTKGNCQEIWKLHSFKQNSWKCQEPKRGKKTLGLSSFYIGNEQWLHKLKVKPMNEALEGSNSLDDEPTLRIIMATKCLQDWTRSEIKQEKKKNCEWRKTHVIHFWYAKWSSYMFLRSAEFGWIRMGLTSMEYISIKSIGVNSILDQYLLNYYLLLIVCY